MYSGGTTDCTHKKEGNNMSIFPRADIDRLIRQLDSMTARAEKAEWRLGEHVAVLSDIISMLRFDLVTLGGIHYDRWQCGDCRAEVSDDNDKSDIVHKDGCAVTRLIKLRDTIDAAITHAKERK